MADWSALTSGFQQGADWRQRFRANRQLEKARDQALEMGDYGVQSARDFRMAENPDAAGVLGEGYAAGNTPWAGGLQDPFSFKMGEWFKQKFAGKKKKKKALDVGGEEFGGSSNPGVAPDMEPAQSYGLGEDYADGGDVSEEEKIRRRAAANRARSSERGGSTTESVQGADRTVKPTRTAIPEGARPGLARRVLNGKLAKGAGALATAGAVLSATDDDYDERANQRFPYLSSTDEQAAEGGPKEALKFGARRALMFASDLGDNLTGGNLHRFYGDSQGGEAPQGAPLAAASPGDAPFETNEDWTPPGGGGSMGASVGARSYQGGGARAALPSAKGPDIVDFSDIDIDPKDVPNMQMDDWKKYRAQMIAAAQKSGNPEAVAQVNNQVTQMQHSGFLNYAQQGFALQQAGNVRGAMAAYRAAFQYFPNGNDVEFGVHKDRKTGRSQIVGFGKDEKTGKVVPGTELVMDPERVSTLIENFKNPQAFRMWTKDWREFEQGRREYEEVRKPLAQAQADYMANNAEARGLTAENQALRYALGSGGGGGMGYKQSDMRGDNAAFVSAAQNMTMDKPEDAEALVNAMARIKAIAPQIPPGVVVYAIKQAYASGQLGQLTPNQIIGQIMQGQAQQRQALPVEPAGDDPTLEGLTPEEREWATRPAQ